MDVPFVSIDTVGTFPQGSRDGSFFDLNVYEDTTFSLLATDGKVSSTDTCTVYFRDKIYYGTSPLENLTEDEIKNLNYSLQKDLKSKFYFTCTDEYGVSIIL